MLITLRSKLFAGYLFVVLLLALVGVYAVFSFRSLTDFSSASLEEYSANSLANLKMYESLVRMNEAEIEMLGTEYEKGSELLYGEPEHFDSSLHSAQRIISQIRQGAKGTIAELLTKVELNWQQYRAQLPEFTKIAKSDQNAARKFYDGILLATFSELKTLTFALSEQNVAAFKRARDESSSQSDNATETVILVTLIATGIGILGSFIIAQKTTAPLRTLREKLKALQEGNLDTRIPISSADEIGDVSYEFNRMTERLERYESMNINRIIAEKQKSESIIASINDPLFLLDADSNVLMMNQAAEEISGIAEANAIGKSIKVLFRNESIIAKIENVLLQNNKLSEQVILEITTNNKIRYYRIGSVSITSYTSENPLIGILLVFTDITHFEEVDRLKSDFIAKVSHEFRTPLTSIRMSLDILADEIIGKVNPEQLDLLITSKTDTDRLAKLIRDLLTLSRLEALPDNRESGAQLDCNVAFDEITRSMKQMFSEKKITLIAKREILPILRMQNADFD
ncbi:MAG: histidine kinase dimerization/phospho-acceptor domain-containing protein, partial [Ignavibacteriota bacterium]